MTEDLNAIPLIIRREIEARIAVPIMQAFAEELGEEKAKAIGSRVIKEMAEESGRQLAIGMGDNGLKSFARTLSIFTQGGALEMDVLEQTDTRLSFNVTRCRYAETYRELGMIDYGTTLSCHRDFALIDGFNPAVRLTRTQTIMEGADFCDFRYELIE